MTLVEVLVVIAIIGLLIGLLLPAVQSSREAGRRTLCLNNVKQLMTAFQAFHNSFGYVPRAYHGAGARNADGTAVVAGSRRGSAFWEMMPFLEQGQLFDRAGGDNYAGMAHWVQLPGLLCPTDSRSVAHANWPAGTTVALVNYALNFQVVGRPRYGDNVVGVSCGGAEETYVNPDPAHTNFTPMAPLSAITDGLSNTLVCGEKYRTCRVDGFFGNAWAGSGWNVRTMPLFAFGNPAGTSSFVNCNGYSHNNVGPNSKPQPAGPLVTSMGVNTCSGMRTQAIHAGGLMTAGFADGSARTIRDDISGDTWWAVCTPKQLDLPGEF
jgi:type II secretory pathway pseudopilin PulG